MSGSASDRSPSAPEHGELPADSRGGAETGFGEPDTGRGLKEKRCSGDVPQGERESLRVRWTAQVPFLAAAVKLPSSWTSRSSARRRRKEVTVSYGRLQIRIHAEKFLHLFDQPREMR